MKKSSTKKRGKSKSKVKSNSQIPSIFNYKFRKFKGAKKAWALFQKHFNNLWN